jgi:hypothetical protein
MNVDYSLLAARIMRPKRGDTWPAKKALRGVTDPAAGWTALASLLPPALANGPNRHFQRPFVAAGDASATPGLELSTSPPTIPACVAIATDSAGILAAEGHARDTVKRLAAWGVRGRESTIWTFVPEWPGADQGGEPLFTAVHACLESAAGGQKKAEIGLRAGYKAGAEAVMGHLTSLGASQAALTQCERFVEVAGYAAMWQRAVKLGLAVPPHELEPGKIVPAAGTAFSELADPFEPMLALMILGYWLSGATDDALVLVGTEPSNER